MHLSMPRLARLVRPAAVTFILVGLPACSWIADTDRIVIAEIDGRSITRGDLFNIIYDMPDSERPRIQSRQDYLRVLNNYIDEEIKIPLGEQLSAEGKIEVSRDEAREAYFQSIKDEKERQTQRHMWEVPVPKPGEETELMRVYNLDAQAIQFQKNVVEQGTDKFQEKLRGDRAVEYLAMEAYKAKELVLDEETLRLEYELAKSSFKSLERMTILGLQFPTAMEGASSEAAQVRRRIDNGEPFDKVLEEYLAKSMNYGIESVIENNPELARFRGFWQEASGAEVGDIRGPVYMPAYTRMKQGEDGQLTQAIVPECYLVFKVLGHEPEKTKTFEEAIPLIAPRVAYAAMMERLRDEHGVVIYEDKLPSPSGGQSTMLQS